MTDGGNQLGGLTKSRPTHGIGRSESFHPRSKPAIDGGIILGHESPQRGYLRVVPNHRLEQEVIGVPKDL